MNKDNTYVISSRGNLQPREKASEFGISVLTDKELLKMIIGSGSEAYPVSNIAMNLVKLFDNSPDVPSIEDLQSINGMGVAKSTLLAAALEFSRRFYHPAHTRITQPSDIYPLLQHMADRQQEYFFTISLNGAHDLIKTRQISQGTLNRTIVHPREVFAAPLMERAASIIVAHNHPSGSLDPSREDRNITNRLKEAGELLGIPVLDHIIFNHNGYYSFMEHDQFN